HVLADDTLTRAIPAQLAVTVLTISQAQLHDFKVVSAVDLPGGQGVITARALTVIAGAHADRAVGIQGTHGHASTTIAERRTVGVATHGGAAVIARTIHGDELE